MHWATDTEIECTDCDGHGHPKGQPNVDLGATDETYSVGLWISRINGLQSHLRIIMDGLPTNAEWLRGQVEAAQREAARYVADFAPCPACEGNGYRAPTADELDNMAEAAYDRQFEGEPPLSARERDEMQAKRDAQWGVK